MNVEDYEDYATQDLAEIKEELEEDIEEGVKNINKFEEPLRRARHDLRNVNWILKTRRLK